MILGIRWHGYVHRSRLSSNLNKWGTLGRSRTNRFYTYHRLRATEKETPRINPVGIQYLSRSLQSQLFKSNQHRGNVTEKEQRRLVELSKQLLKLHNLDGQKTAISDPIDFKLPPLEGKSLDEHFQKIGHFTSEPYRSMCDRKFVKVLPKPENWILASGWIRYEPGCEPIHVDAPQEDILVFDVETMYNISPYATLATAVSQKAWYGWCSPYLCEEDESPEHLIPLNTLQDQSKLIIGHNVGYDRARVLDEYNLEPTKSFFLDTQSLHVASAGLCSRQRPVYKQRQKSLSLRKSQKAFEEREDTETLQNDPDPWFNVSAMNSLKDVAKFHCGITLNKETRDWFASTDKKSILENFNKLMHYCADDVAATSQVFDKVFPLFVSKCPHPVSFGGLRSMSSCILPTNYEGWNNYIHRSEKIYQESKTAIEDKIITIVEDLVKLKDEPNYGKKIQEDPWLSQLNWEIKPTRYTKKGELVKSQKLPGFPEWYRSLFPSKGTKKPKITIKTRTIPLLFRLTWEKKPVYWSSNSGWCFPIKNNEIEQYKDKNYILADQECIDDFRESTGSDDEVIFRIPHPSGPEHVCTTLLSKPYIHFFEKGILQSSLDIAHDALSINSSGAYWMASRERIMSQFVVRRSNFKTALKNIKGRINDLESSSQNEKMEKINKDLGLILPAIIPMGTVTRRAVENTWLTASNAKINRIGSELKAQVKAPEGYCFVGADVDSEELWIASLVSDSVFHIHGGTPLGWMCLEGTKAQGTDLHTKTAQILGCTRNEAKIFNYGRIYGAGVKFAALLLKQFNPSLSDQRAKEVATELYESTKGKSYRSKYFAKFWFGGSESILFNKLESIAEKDEPRTPVLGCGITSSLMKKNLGINSFLPSRINWAIQSSGVDYLHLLCCSMNYLIEKYKLRARMCISIHDEIRYMAAEEDKYKVVMALQVSNIWTRAMFCEQLGIKELPQNCAFFSSVDVDHVLRKEVDMDCITPSNNEAIPPGESLDIRELLEIPDAALTDPDPDIDLSIFSYEPREPVFSEYDKSSTKEYLEYFLKMQVQNSKWKVKDLEKEFVLQEASKVLGFSDEGETYSLSEYLRDVKEKKRKKATIMNVPFRMNNPESSLPESVVKAPIENLNAHKYNELIAIAGSTDTDYMRPKLRNSHDRSPRKRARFKRSIEKRKEIDELFFHGIDESNDHANDTEYKGPIEGYSFDYRTAHNSKVFSKRANEMVNNEVHISAQNDSLNSRNFTYHDLNAPSNKSGEEIFLDY